jgi:hypothetical protein
VVTLPAARHVGARAAGLVDAGLVSLAAEWVEAAAVALLAETPTTSRP